MNPEINNKNNQVFKDFDLKDSIVQQNSKVGRYNALPNIVKHICEVSKS